MNVRGRRRSWERKEQDELNRSREAIVVKEEESETRMERHFANILYSHFCSILKIYNLFSDLHH
jgi:hypothetical protein